MVKNLVKLLANQLRVIEAKQFITKITREDGSISSDNTEINNTFRNFYSRLYFSEFHNDNNLMEDYLNQLNIPMLSSDNKTRLDAPLSQFEIAAAISSLQSGKSPGPDGFPVEFFKLFSCLLSHQLSLVLLDSLKQGKLPPSFYETSITLIA